MSENAAPLAISAGPTGIGGWLILPVIGLVVTPLRGLLTFGQYAALSDSLPYLTGPQSVFVIAELAVNVVMLLIAPIVLLVLLLQRKRSFPKLFMVWGLASLAVVILDLIVADILFAEAFQASGQALIDGDTARELFRSLFLAAVWVPYMAMSRRVKNTFVE